MDAVKTDEQTVLKKAQPVATKSATKKPARRAKRRPVPYDRIAKLWAKGKTIAEIAKAIDRVGKGHDPFHSLRVILTKMHGGYRTKDAKIVKLPHRVSRKTVKLSAEAGKRAGAR